MQSEGIMGVVSETTPALFNLFLEGICRPCFDKGGGGG